ncbi:10402_t:CDS:1, partial [Racocetra persica]
IIQALNDIKEKAPYTHDKPSQIIQDAIINMPEASFCYMPNNEAIRKQISRIRNKELPSHPQSLEDINVLALLRTTVQRERFLVKEI